ncbi:MAG TPA: hypothetical protein VGB34_08800 [Candidatus Limnocylindria bacterium]|jgi:hypothetical protein
MAENRDAVLPRVREQAVPGETGYALVWIDSKLARILRWRGRVVTEKLDSNLPPHVRGTAHVRHDPLVRHGGSGRGQDDAERRRNEHLRAFLDAVADRLGDDDQIEVLGTGTVGERLATLLRRQTARRPSPPSIMVLHSMPLTPRQLAARLRQRLGLDRRRRTVGAYRWSGELPLTRSGGITGPRRVLEKNPPSVGRTDPEQD